MSATAASPTSGQHAELIFRRELAEVYVLLDFISGRPDAHLWTVDLDIPCANDPTTKETAFNLYKRIAQMRYPPDAKTTIEENAYNATILLYVKDKLNSAAAPARGMTIAYTYIYLGENFVGDEHHKATSEDVPRFLFDGETKASVAREAFPGLISSAYRLRKKRKWTSRFGLGVFALAAILLCWTVYGSVVIKRFEDDRNIAAELQKNVYTQMFTDKSTTSAHGISGDVTMAYCRDAEGTLSPTARGLCNDWAYYQARYEKAIADAGVFTAHSSLITWMFHISPTLKRQEFVAANGNTTLSSQGEEATGVVAAALAATPGTNPLASDSVVSGRAASNALASNTLASSSSDASAAKRPIGDAPHQSDEPHFTSTFNQEDVQSIGLVLSVCSTYVLPLIFGVVGTIAAFLRDIGNKTFANTLSPRDENLIFVRLLLGAIAGIAVGLFYSPTQSAQQVVTGAGILTLSASGFSFLAGYAADLFFSFLDKLVTSAFRIAAPEANGK